jgi:hypothetical protein
MNENISNNIQVLYKLYKHNFKSSQKSKKNYYFLYAIKYFTDIHTSSNTIIPNFNIIIQACSNVNNLFIDKINNSQNKNKIIVEKNNYSKNVSNIKHNQTDKQNEKDKKEQIKNLKQIADTKMKLKINTVEQIDSLILKGKI